jgi:acetyl-CoA carboxylase biotin carboxylase subunit
MFSKVLIANRGEIALRIIRACRELGVRSVAVCSDADTHSPHVRAADEAVNIGPAPSSESYLLGDRIIAAALATGAEAIHPGYGFLSEREWFARAVRDAGLTFIGPPAEAIAAMGGKTAARQLAIGAGVPIVPGTVEALRDASEAATVAERFGYPVLLKAAAGGGGKGMRVVREPRELEAALEAARSEARKAFGDDAVYVEKFIEGPRHVEIQILADQHGTVLSLGERSVRAAASPEDDRGSAVGRGLGRVAQADGRTAVAAARAAGYVNAGTCEFLLAPDGEFYFLEMNTWLQVEHPVTELVTGSTSCNGRSGSRRGRLALPADLSPRGWAIECRITSEDPANGFLPSTGRIEYLHAPSGPGVRWDSGVETGSTVGLHYDPMLAKLIVWGATRDEAIERMHRALSELTIVGVESSREFHLRVMEDQEFRRGAIEIQWLERRLASLIGAQPLPGDMRVAAIAAVLLADRDRGLRRTVNGPAAPAAGRAEGADAWTHQARHEGLR